MTAQRACDAYNRVVDSTVSETFINKVITKAGDGGMTNLVYKDVHKSEPIIECIGSIDEANSQIGAARFILGDRLADFDSILDEIQNNLFDLAADLIAGTNKIDQNYIKEIESVATKINATLAPLKSFVLPKGPAAPLHVARTIVRRAERAFWRYDQLLEGVRLDIETNKYPGMYLNRLSDLLFIICRAISDQEQEWSRIK